MEHKVKKVKIEIADKEYICKLAITNSEKSKGLMNKKSMPENEGMLFIYPREESTTFWMKDTLIPLDIVFLNEDLEVISVKQGVPLSEEYIEEDGVKFVLEVNANSGIEQGDDLEVIKGEEVIEESEDELSENEDIDDCDDCKKDDEESEELYGKMLDSNGDTQYIIKGGERIFSRKNSKILIKKAKKADKTKSDSDYKALGKIAFKYLKIQDERGNEYIEN